MDTDRLIQSLAKPGASLAALFVVTGDDPLLTIEAADALRAIARAAGFLDRTSFVMDARSDWSALGVASGSGSLFGDKQLMEISIPTGKPGKQGADALIALASRWKDSPFPTSCASPPPTTPCSKWAAGSVIASTTKTCLAYG